MKFLSTFSLLAIIIKSGIFGGFIMIDIEKEANNYIAVCSDLKGLSALTIKAYKIDLKQFCSYMQDKDCFSKNELNKYINSLHQHDKPKTAKRKIACVKRFTDIWKSRTLLKSIHFTKLH